jgi:hypothetical protein
MNRAPIRMVATHSTSVAFQSWCRRSRAGNLVLSLRDWYGEELASARQVGADELMRCKRHPLVTSAVRGPHDDHRDLRPRVDAAASTNGNRDQDRHFMSATGIFPHHNRALPCRSSNGHASAWPHTAPALILFGRACPKHSLSVAKESRTRLGGSRNHSSRPPARLAGRRRDSLCT